MRFAIVFAFALATFSGCTPGNQSAKDAHNSGKGTTRIYDATLDQTWDAVHAALRWDGAGAPEDHRVAAGESYVLSNPDSSSPSYNSQVGVWLDPMNTEKTRVNVVVVGPDSAQGAPNERDVQKDIETAVNLIKTGQPVPEKRP